MESIALSISEMRPDIHIPKSLLNGEKIKQDFKSSQTTKQIPIFQSVKVLNIDPTNKLNQ